MSEVLKKKKKRKKKTKDKMQIQANTNQIKVKFSSFINYGTSITEKEVRKACYLS